LIKLFKTGSPDDVTMWYVEDKPVCGVCGEYIIDHNAAFIVDWTKKGRKETLIHDRCVNNYDGHPLSVAQFRWTVLLSDIVPPRGVPVLIQPPILGNSKSNLSVFDSESVISDTTTDRAYKSKEFPSLEGAIIGLPCFVEQSDPDAFIKELFENSRQEVLEHKARKARLLDAPDIEHEDLDDRGDSVE